ncbi:MAG: helix-turn-helix transcriptional regulator [Bacilli bacterium]|nr:helix-turn-helix transcriptional regulator [Bacilli bacterium]
MKNYFFKPELENLSQGARLKFVRELRYMSKPNVAEFLELGGEKPTDSIDKYERNAREPQPERLKDLVELFDVSNYAIRGYYFVYPNEVIYQHMWEEELCPYSEFIFDKDAMKKTFYNEDIIRGFEAWEEMKIRRENGEISDSEYIEWKLHFDLKDLD